MPNQFLSDEFGDIEDYFVTDYWLIDQFVGDTLFTWGLNSFYGPLGINNTDSKNTPVTTFAGGTNWKQVSMGQDSSAAIKTDGSLWTWGRNDFAQLGINNTTERLTPVTTFTGGNNWKSVSCGRYHTAAIKTDGSLWTWGRNDGGQLGINESGDLTGRSTPVTTFAGGNNWKSVACGYASNMAAIKTDGSLWMWGFDNDGNLGINGGGSRSTPVTTFAGGTNWKQVTCGRNHTAAIKTDGSLWTWGFGGSNLGAGVLPSNRLTPITTFAGGTNWKSVSARRFHTAAIKTDGSLWTWGTNNNGQLGTNDVTERFTPVTTFAGGNNWKSVDLSFFTSVAAIKTDGTLWVWGEGGSGRLGTNDTTNRSTPVTTFSGGNNWKQVACGGQQTAAVKSGLNVDLS
jgi:alpha-tubulin suppressor-like RCC1 family protein